VLGLPDGITTCLFDLDGVLTPTARIHAEAWKQMFDEFLCSWYSRNDKPFREFVLPDDYEEYVDGKPRRDGVRSFLQSRGIELPEGSPDDPPEADTIYGLGLRKNDIVLKLIHDDGVEPYDGSVRFVQKARDQGLRRAVVSSSTNCEDVLIAAGIADLFEAQIEPAAAAVFEDALAGVEAGRAGHFGWVIGVDRTGHGRALHAHGADDVVEDLAELLERP
jgi:beta-phosphoglucomutase-like phosphatase (HAD superfamily)